jgi:hypothetical protein
LECDCPTAMFRKIFKSSPVPLKFWPSLWAVLDCRSSLCSSLLIGKSMCAQGHWLGWPERCQVAWLFWTSVPEILHHPQDSARSIETHSYSPYANLGQQIVKCWNTFAPAGK